MRHIGKSLLVLLVCLLSSWRENRIASKVVFVCSYAGGSPLSVCLSLRPCLHPQNRWEQDPQESGQCLSKPIQIVGLSGDVLHAANRQGSERLTIQDGGTYTSDTNSECEQVDGCVKIRARTQAGTQASNQTNYKFRARGLGASRIYVLHRYRNPMDMWQRETMTTRRSKSQRGVQGHCDRDRG